MDQVKYRIPVLIAKIGRVDSDYCPFPITNHNAPIAVPGSQEKVSAESHLRDIKPLDRIALIVRVRRDLLRTDLHTRAPVA